MSSCQATSNTPLQHKKSVTPLCMKQDDAAAAVPAPSKTRKTPNTRPKLENGTHLVLIQLTISNSSDAGTLAGPKCHSCPRSPSLWLNRPGDVTLKNGYFRLRRALRAIFSDDVTPKLASVRNQNFGHLLVCHRSHRCPNCSKWYSTVEHLSPAAEKVVAIRKIR
jgi:hypothetical protein